MSCKNVINSLKITLSHVREISNLCACVIANKLYHYFGGARVDLTNLYKHYSAKISF